MAERLDAEGKVYYDGDFLITAAELEMLGRPKMLPAEASERLLAEPRTMRRQVRRQSRRAASRNVAK